MLLSAGCFFGGNNKTICFGHGDNCAHNCHVKINLPVETGPVRKQTVSPIEDCKFASEHRAGSLS